jgi:hypothetical protein
MTVLAIVIAIFVVLVGLTYAWGVRHPGPRITRRRDGARRRTEDRELL